MIGYHDLDGLGILDELQSLCAAAAGQHLVVDSDRPRENVQQEGVVVYTKHSRSAFRCNSHDTMSPFIGFSSTLFGLRIAHRQITQPFVDRADLGIKVGQQRSHGGEITGMPRDLNISTKLTYL